MLLSNPVALEQLACSVACTILPSLTGEAVVFEQALDALSAPQLLLQLLVASVFVNYPAR